MRCRLCLVAVHSCKVCQSSSNYEETKHIGIIQWVHHVVFFQFHELIVKSIDNLCVADIPIETFYSLILHRTPCNYSI